MLLWRGHIMQPFETKVETPFARELARLKSTSVLVKQNGSTGGLQLAYEDWLLPNKRPGMPAENCSGAVAPLGSRSCRDSRTTGCFPNTRMGTSPSALGFLRALMYGGTESRAAFQWAAHLSRWRRYVP
eukprot:370425-Amphidinium_carterae.1